MSTRTPIDLPARIARLQSALPEMVAAGTFAIAWVAPGRLPWALLRSLVLVMLVEFLIVHSAGFLGGALLAEGVSTGKRVGTLLGFGAFYLLFAGAFGLAFGSWSPVVTLLWLVGSRVLTVVVDPRPTEDERHRQASLWAVGALLYLIGVFVTTLLPIPKLGVTEAVRDGLDLPGSGLWIDQPHRVFVFGLLYFALLALVEVTDFRFARSSLPTLARRPKP